MRYVKLVRVSTKEQDVEMQIMETNRYIDMHNTHNDEVIEFSEPETSTKIHMDDRPVLQEMMKTVKRGDVLVVYKVDRLARDGDQLVYIYKTITKKGVTIVSLYEKHIDDANIHIYAFMGEKERENIRIRTKSGLKRKQEKLEKVGATWYGYKVDETKLQLEKELTFSYGKPYLLIPEEEESKQVSKMVELYKTGLNYREIAIKMKELGHKNRKGNPVQEMTIYRVLHRLGVPCRNPRRKLAV